MKQIIHIFAIYIFSFSFRFFRICSIPSEILEDPFILFWYLNDE